MSLLSGRTNGVSETVLAAAVGFPGMWAELQLAPSSTFNLGVRASAVYGSPFLGFGGGIGGELAIPMRFHLNAQAPIDVALFVSPSVVLGQGVLFGQGGTFEDDFGYGTRLELGPLVGIQVSEAVTLVGGLVIAPAYVWVPEGSTASHWLGSASARLGLEALAARDTLLFIEAELGYGLASESLFSTHMLARLSVGMAYGL